jgi:hypothetical protein
MAEDDDRRRRQRIVSGRQHAPSECTHAERGEIAARDVRAGSETGSDRSITAWMSVKIAVV